VAIRAAVPGFPADGDRSPRRMKPMAVAPGKGRAAGKVAAAAADAAEVPEGKGRFLLVPEHAGFRHRGIDLASVVEGLAELHLEEGLRMNADDMARLGVEPGGAVTINIDGVRHDGGTAGAVQLVLAARPDPDCPRGAVYASGLELWGGPTRPVRIRVSAGDRSRPARPPRAAAAGRARPRARGGEHVQGR
jgi:hypothetical protein